MLYKEKARIKCNRHFWLWSPEKLHSQELMLTDWSCDDVGVDQWPTSEFYLNLRWENQLSRTRRNIEKTRETRENHIWCCVCDQTLVPISPHSATRASLAPAICAVAWDWGNFFTLNRIVDTWTSSVIRFTLTQLLLPGHWWKKKIGYITLYFIVLH